ncbi:PFP-BETA1 [Symbiodinium sp. KB8]|nr:PFP-BETA1 [Symbiodinium sp. KB8]
MTWRVAVAGHRKSGPQAGNAIFSYVVVASQKTFRSWSSACEYALKEGLEAAPYWGDFFLVDGTPKVQALAFGVLRGVWFGIVTSCA